MGLWLNFWYCSFWTLQDRWAVEEVRGGSQTAWRCQDQIGCSYGWDQWYHLPRCCLQLDLASVYFYQMILFFSFKFVKSFPSCRDYTKFLVFCKYLLFCFCVIFVILLNDVEEQTTWNSSQSYIWIVWRYVIFNELHFCCCDVEDISFINWPAILNYKIPWFLFRYKIGFSFFLDLVYSFFHWEEKV